MNNSFLTRKLPLVGLFVALIAINACDYSAVYKNYVDIDNGEWHVDTIPTFDFTISDASKNYQVDYNIRYTVDYPFRNLYVTYVLEDSSGNVLQSDLQEINLFENKSGEPMGKGLGDIFNLEVRGISPLKVAKNGSYRVKLRQFMRRETLDGIISVGIVVRPQE